MESDEKQQKKSPKPIDCTGCKYKCSRNFPDAIRAKICESFWRLNDYRRQKDFILANVKSAPPKRRRPTVEGGEVKRTNSKTFHLRDKRVCQSFFLKTLCISNGPLIKAFQFKNEYTNVFDADDRRGKHEPGNKIKRETVAAIVDHLTAKCLADSAGKFRRKVICDASVRSLRGLYNKFKAASGVVLCPSYTTFKRIFHEHNFSLPHERLKAKPPTPKVDVQDVEILHEVVELEQPKVIVAQVPDPAKFIHAQPEVYEIQFYPIQAINAIQ